MARYIFGGSTSDFTYAVYTSGGRKYPVLEPATLTFWDSETGGVQQTVTLNGTDVTSVTVGTDGLIPDFLGPDGVTALWADAGAGRVRMTTSDPLGALSPVATTGAYSDLSGKPTIPATAADVGADTAGAASAVQQSLNSYKSSNDTAVGKRVKVWESGESVAAGDARMMPSGDVMTAKTAHTTGSTPTYSNWQLGSQQTATFARQTGGVASVTGPTLPADLTTGTHYVWNQTDPSTGDLLDIVTGVAS